MKKVDAEFLRRYYSQFTIAHHHQCEDLFMKNIYLFLSLCVNVVLVLLVVAVRFYYTKK